MRLASVNRGEFRNYSAQPLATPLDFRTKKAHYQAKVLLAEGGMSEVYLADKREGPPSIPDRVVIKCLPAYVAGSGPALLSALQREARHLSVLDGKKGIVRLLDSKYDNTDNSFLVLDFLEGVSLDRVRERCAPLDMDEARLLLLRLVHLFSYCHQMGIVHNDAKPTNVMISPDLSPRLFDFGISREIGDTVEHFEGSAIYMPPEKIIDTRPGILPSLDVYPLGIIICEILSGKYPYQDIDLTTASVIALLKIHSWAKPSKLSHLMEGVKIPSGLDDIVDLCLEKNPAQRFQHAGAVLHALESVLGALKPEEM